MKIALRKQLSNQTVYKRFLGIFQLSRPRKRAVLEVHLPRLASLAIFILIGSWTTVAGLFYLRERANPYTEVSYLQIALPWNWKAMLAERARGYSEAGKAAFNEGRFREALVLLRAAVGRRPDDTSARSMLARIYAAGRRIDLALKVLESGIGRGVEADAVATQLMFSLYNVTFQHEAGIQTAERIRELSSASPEVHEIADRAAIYMLYTLKDWERLASVAAYGSGVHQQQAIFPIFESLALAKLGRDDAAEAVLKTRPAIRDNPPGLLFAKVFLSLEKPLGISETRDIRTLIDSSAVPSGHKAEIISRLYEIEEIDLAEASLLLAIQHYSQQPTALLRIADRIGGKMLPDSAELVVETVLANDRDLAPPTVNVFFESCFEHQELDRFKRFFRKWESRLAASPNFRFIEWVRPLINFLDVGGNASREMLLVNLNATPAPPDTMIALTEVLLLNKNRDLASRVAEIAAGVYPNHAEILELNGRLNKPEFMRGLSEFENL